MMGFNFIRFRRCRRPSILIAIILVAIFVHITIVGISTRTTKLESSSDKMVPMGYGLLGMAVSSFISSGKSDTSGRQSCVHPQLQLWHPEIKPFFKKPSPLKCDSVDKNWVYTANGTFYISADASKANGGHIDCKITPIRRGKDDFKVTRGDSIAPFKNETTLVSDVFEANCVSGDAKVNSMVLLGVAPKQEVRDRASATKSLPKSALDLDILMFGFDSVSRMTWMRNLPKSYEYFVKQLGGVVLEGYNVVGDGTPQALLPILTGKTEIELPEARRGFSGAKTVDDHPWIWKDLSKLGYATQWGEDSASFGTFTYRMLGFKTQPVDHYMRTFYVEAEKHYKKYPSQCLGSLPRHLNMLNYMKDFIDVYSSQRKFSFVFHAEYSHGGYSELQLADEDLLQFLQYLKMRGHLDKAILILMADHGARFQKLRSTEQGKYEERMPFFGVRLPESFIESHPEAAKNLKINSGRLTTPFDIHATFRDVIDFGGDKSEISEDPDKPLPRGISLFREIPKRRSCLDAAIEPHWCACLSWQTVSVRNPVVVKASTAVISQMNRATASERDSCEVLRLGEVVTAVRYSTNDHVLRFSGSSDIHGRVPQMLDKMNKSEDLYQVTIKAEPGGGMFEATVRHLLNNNDMLVELSAVSRINRYGNQPHCVAEKLPHLRPYCYCKVQLEPIKNHADENHRTLHLSSETTEKPGHYVTDIAAEIKYMRDRPSTDTKDNESNEIDKRSKKEEYQNNEELHRTNSKNDIAYSTVHN